MKKLLIGSVYGPSKKIDDLLKLQHLFFHNTDVKGLYDHVGMLNTPNIPRRMYGVKVIEQNKSMNEPTNRCHANGLEKIREFFLKKRSLYDYFLFIDSDAWPIRKDWYTCLIKKMKNGRNEKKVAAVRRFENLENRYHASVLFCTAEALHHLSFAVAKKGDVEDINGYPEEDVWIGKKYQNSPRSVYSLIRTNKVNVHPVWSGVYGDLFYHHGGGTKQCQGRSFHYHSYVGTPEKIRRFSNLKKDPCKYIAELAGWSPGRYVEFKELV